jgi:hypothetical protein
VGSGERTVPPCYTALHITIEEIASVLRLLLPSHRPLLYSAGLVFHAIQVYSLIAVYKLNSKFML